MNKVYKWFNTQLTLVNDARLRACIYISVVHPDGFDTAEQMYRLVGNAFAIEILKNKSAHGLNINALNRVCYNMVRHIEEGGV